MSFNQKELDDKKRAADAESLSNEELIEKIFVASGTDYFNNTENVGKSVAYFSVLISRLSINSDKLQKRGLFLNYILTILTLVLMLTIPQVNEFVFGKDSSAVEPPAIQSKAITENNTPNKSINKDIKS